MYCQEYLMYGSHAHYGQCGGQSYLRLGAFLQYRTPSKLVYRYWNVVTNRTYLRFRLTYGFHREQQPLFAPSTFSHGEHQSRDVPNKVQVPWRWPRQLDFLLIGTVKSRKVNIDITTELLTKRTVVIHTLDTSQLHLISSSVILDYASLGLSCSPFIQS